MQTHVVDGNHAGDTLVEFAKKLGSDIIDSVQQAIDLILSGSQQDLPVVDGGRAVGEIIAILAALKNLHPVTVDF